MANSSSDPRPSSGRRSLRESMNLGNGPAKSAKPQRPVDDDDDWGMPKKPEALEEASAEESASILNSLRRQTTATEPEAPAEPDEDPAEVEAIQGENEQLRGIVDELRQQLDQVVGDVQSGWGEREKEYEAMLEQKSDTIRELHARLQELERGGAGEEEAKAPVNVDQKELLSLSDELERERCQLEQERKNIDDDRKQLREDEDAMMRQMREMEMQMARERAELARQRNELQRLHSEIRHELELAQRDAAVNERLRLLQRKSNQLDPEASGRKSSSETPAAGKKRTLIADADELERLKDKGKAKKDDKKDGGTGFFGRFFNK